MIHHPASNLLGEPPQLPNHPNAQATTVPQSIQQYFAAKWSDGNLSIKAAYQIAIAELHAVNIGQSTAHPKPASPYRMFSYETFRRRCNALEQLRRSGHRANNVVAGRFRGSSRTPHEGVEDIRIGAVQAITSPLEALAPSQRVGIGCRAAAPASRLATVTGGGVHLFGLHYGCAVGVPKLLRNNVRMLPGSKAGSGWFATEFIFDPEDISRIHLWDPSARSFVTLTCWDVLDTYPPSARHPAPDRRSRAARLGVPALRTKKRSKGPNPAS